MSGRAVRLRAAAERDLRNVAAWYRQEGGFDLADRFISAAESTFAKLAEAPGLGAPAEARAAGLTDARRWPVDGFSSRLIFYRPARDGILILRVLHAAQDWKRR